MNYLHELLFSYYPYLAGTVFLVGCLVRYDREQYTWKAGSSQMLHSKNFRIANNCFHIGILLLFFGHFFGLLTPHQVYEAIGLSSGTKQIIAITAGGLFGTLCFVGMTMLVVRRLTNVRVRATSSKSDIFILLLIYIQLILGLCSIFVSSHHTDGEIMLVLASWAQHIVTFQPDAGLMLLDIHWIYKMHIFVGLTMFLCFPFTRLVHIWSLPMGYFARSYQVVRRKNRFARPQSI